MNYENRDDEYYQRAQEVGGSPHERLTGREAVDFDYPEDGDGAELDEILEQLTAKSISAAAAKTRLLRWRGESRMEEWGAFLHNLLSGWMELAKRSPIAAAAIRALGLHGERTVRDAAAEIGCSPSLIAKHEKRLKAAMRSKG